MLVLGGMSFNEDSKQLWTGDPFPKAPLEEAAGWEGIQCSTSCTHAFQAEKQPPTFESPQQDQRLVSRTSAAKTAIQHYLHANPQGDFRRTVEIKGAGARPKA